MSSTTGLRRAADFLPEVIAEMNRPRLVTTEDGCFCVHDPEQYASTYDIPISECEDRDELLRWVRQLTDKRWVTLLVIHDFVRAAIRHFEVKG